MGKEGDVWEQLSCGVAEMYRDKNGLGAGGVAWGLRGRCEEKMNSVRRESGVGTRRGSWGLEQRHGGRERTVGTERPEKAVWRKGQWRWDWWNGVKIETVGMEKGMMA